MSAGRQGTFDIFKTMKRVFKNNKEFIKEIQKKDCFLCKEPSSLTIFEDDDFVVVLDKHPAVEGHVICAPKEHVEHLSNLSEEKAQRFMLLLRRLDSTITELFNPFRVAIVRIGLAVAHLRFHIIPVPDEEMMWDLKYLRKDNIIEYSEEEIINLIRKISSTLN